MNADLPLLNSPTTTSRKSEVRCSAASAERVLIVRRSRVCIEDRRESLERSQFGRQ